MVNLINLQVKLTRSVLCLLTHHSFQQEFVLIGTLSNRLHWVKDVVECEDTSPPLQGNASPNISILKSWVLSLVRVNGYDSLTEAIRYLSHDLKYLLSFCH